MRFIIARAARHTGEILERLVREELAANHVAEPDCVVSYGAGYTGNLPTLNAHCSDQNKMEQGVTLHRALVEDALMIIPASNLDRISQCLPVVGRKVQHTKGKDIRVCRTMAGVRVALAKGRQFFTPVMESDTEYRAWVYRKRILAVYEKRLTEPENNVKFGRNRANGWTFHQLASEEIPENVRRVAVAAVRALSLDFGAVDILGKWDRERVNLQATVLEVNSAPGVSDEHRSGIVKLAHRIVKWAAAGCPARED